MPLTNLYLDALASGDLPAFKLFEKRERRWRFIRP
jgi:hypothetical protein